MAAFAEHEREMVRERTKAALAAAKARGVRLGVNGAVLAARHRTDATAFAEQLRESVERAMASGACSATEIADRFNAEGLSSRQGGSWHPASVSRVLHRLGFEKLTKG